MVAVVLPVAPGLNSLILYTSLRPTGFGLGHASLCITVHPLPLHNTHPIPPKAPFWQWDRMSNFFVSHADVRTLYTVQYQVNTMAVSWPPETIQRRFFFVRPWIKTDLSYRKIAPKTGRVTFWRTKKVASGKYNSFAACVVFSTNYYYFYITLCVSTFKNWHSVSPSPYI